MPLKTVSRPIQRAFLPIQNSLRNLKQENFKSKMQLKICQLKISQKQNPCESILTQKVPHPLILLTRKFTPKVSVNRVSFCTKFHTCLYQAHRTQPSYLAPSSFGQKARFLTREIRPKYQTPFTQSCHLMGSKEASCRHIPLH